MRGKAQATLLLERVILDIVEERAPITVRGLAMVEVQHGGPRTKGQKQERKNALNGKRSDHLATMFGVNGKYVEQARKVVTGDPAAAG